VATRPQTTGSPGRSLAAAAALAFLSEGNQLLAQARIQSSQSATANGDLVDAFADAVDARDLKPWAATPYLQMALVAEQQRELVTASQAIAEAIDRAPDDWRLWLVRSRIEAKRGMVESGVQLLHAREA
jgi:Tfp pilus assembly protein PilF